MRGQTSLFLGKDPTLSSRGVTSDSLRGGKHQKSWNKPRPIQAREGKDCQKYEGRKNRDYARRGGETIRLEIPYFCGLWHEIQNLVQNKKRSDKESTAWVVKRRLMLGGGEKAPLNQRLWQGAIQRTRAVSRGQIQGAPFGLKPAGAEKPKGERKPQVKGESTSLRSQPMLCRGRSAVLDIFTGKFLDGRRRKPQADYGQEKLRHDYITKKQKWVSLFQQSAGIRGIMRKTRRKG